MITFQTGYTPTEAQRQEWAAWLAERPPAVRTVAERFPPWALFLLTTTGQHARLLSVSEMQDGRVTAKAVCWQPEEPALTARIVFGLDPDDLIPVDVAGPPAA